jgi:RHS repeat-associated protein
MQTSASEKLTRFDALSGAEPPLPRFSRKALDAETGFYYYGARYLNPKTSMWISADPAVGDYIPSAPVDDEAKKHNENLPGMGGVFNYVNMHVYHYAGNNPVKYVDPDGKIFNFLAGAALGFIVSTASEIIPKMVQGQSFFEAVDSVIHDPVAISNIAVSTVVGAATSGVSSMATKGVTEVGKIAARNIAINTVAGGIDAGAKDVAKKIVTGSTQNIGETLEKTAIGMGVAFVASGVTQGTIASKSMRASQGTNPVYGLEANARVVQPTWAKTAGVMGEVVFPAAVDTVRTIQKQHE